jgi:hypothetical protein
MHCTDYYLANECTGIDVSHETKLKYWLKLLLN